MVFALASHGQQTAAPAQPFPAGAWLAIAHGKPAEAEALAQARPADDPAAIAVLAHLDIAEGTLRGSAGETATRSESCPAQ